MNKITISKEFKNHFDSLDLTKLTIPKFNEYYHLSNITLLLLLCKFSDGYNESNSKDLNNIIKKQGCCIYNLAILLSIACLSDLFQKSRPKEDIIQLAIPITKLIINHFKQKKINSENILSIILILYDSCYETIIEKYRIKGIEEQILPNAKQSKELFENLYNMLITSQPSLNLISDCYFFVSVENIIGLQDGEEKFMAESFLINEKPAIVFTEPIVINGEIIDLIKLSKQILGVESNEQFGGMSKSARNALLISMGLVGLGANLTTGQTTSSINSNTKYNSYVVENDNDTSLSKNIHSYNQPKDLNFIPFSTLPKPTTKVEAKTEETMAITKLSTSEKATKALSEAAAAAGAAGAAAYVAVAAGVNTITTTTPLYVTTILTGSVANTGLTAAQIAAMGPNAIAYALRSGQIIGYGATVTDIGGAIVTTTTVLNIPAVVLGTFVVGGIATGLYYFKDDLYDSYKYIFSSSPQGTSEAISEGISESISETTNIPKASSQVSVFGIGPQQYRDELRAKKKYENDLMKEYYRMIYSPKLHPNISNNNKSIINEAIRQVKKKLQADAKPNSHISTEQASLSQPLQITEPTWAEDLLINLALQNVFISDIVFFIAVFSLLVFVLSNDSNNKRGKTLDTGRLGYKPTSLDPSFYTSKPLASEPLDQIVNIGQTYKNRGGKKTKKHKKQKRKTKKI